MNGYYILVDRVPKRVGSVEQLCRWLSTNEHTRRVALDKIGDVTVSTVFLTFDHSWGDGPPLLFETMIFGGPHDQYQERCSTWEQAEAMHAAAVALAKEE